MRADDLVKQIVDEMQPVLQDYAIEFGLDRTKARSLRLGYAEGSWTVDSKFDLNAEEYGDGLGPAPRPIHKAMNKLHPEIERLLEQRVNEIAFDRAAAAF